MARRALVLVALLPLVPMILQSQTTVTFDRLVNAVNEPQNWLTYSGTYASNRYSELAQVTPANVNNLELKWLFQNPSLLQFQATPLVVDGVMYVTHGQDVFAIDGETGRVFWTYRHTPDPKVTPCCSGGVNRGVGILGDTLFMTGVDAVLLAIDAKTGRLLWKTQFADPTTGYASTVAPLVIKDKVLIGPAGGEYGIRGFLAAFDARTGREVWRFNTVPGPEEPGHETWEGGGEAWKNGGAPIWLTGSYDPELNLTYWGTGNPGPDWNPAQRPGDNLFSCSVIALDADTGKLKWYFQFSPNDPYDYDATQIPVLVDMVWNGSPSKLMLWANRNGFYYVLDRATGKFLKGDPFVKVNWASGLNEKGRPIRTPQSEGSLTYPGNQGGTNWYSPSFSPRTELFYISAWEDYATIFGGAPAVYVPGQRFLGGKPRSPTFRPPGTPGLGRGPLNTWTEAAGRGTIIALDPRSGRRQWEFGTVDVNSAGILTTASDLLWTGTRDGYFIALDARNGTLLWKAALGGQIIAGPMTYQVGGKQYVAIASGTALASFALRD